MTPSPAGRIAIVHDYVTQRGGAERLVGEMVRLLPEAILHTSVLDPAQAPDTLRATRIRTTPLQRVYARGVPLTLLAPLLPTAFGRMRLADADLVISSTSAFAHHVRPPAGAVHVAYCHAPPHFLWGIDDYFRGRELRGRLVSPALAMARRSDLAAARRVDVYVANSGYTAERIRTVYGRDAVVVYPPVETASLSRPTNARAGSSSSRASGGTKRLDLAIAAATRSGRPLDVIGDGPDEPALRRAAGPTVPFLGRAPDAVVRAAMARCTALLVPGTEDFGLTMAEVQAAGRPPVAFAGGGALEIIDDGATGFLFAEATVESLSAAMDRAAQADLDPARSSRRLAASTGRSSMPGCSASWPRPGDERSRGPLASEPPGGHRRTRRSSGRVRVRDPHRDQPDGRPINLARRPIEDVAPSYSDLLLPFTYVGMLGILALWAVSVMCRPRRLDPGPAFIWLPVAGLLGVALVGVPFSIDPTLTGYNVVRLLVMVGIGGYVINEVPGLERLAVPVMLMIGIEAAVAIGQAILPAFGRVDLAVRDPERRQRQRRLGDQRGRRLALAAGVRTDRPSERPRRDPDVRAAPPGGRARGGAADPDHPARSVRARRCRALPDLLAGAWIALAVGFVVAIGMLAVRRDRAGVRRWATAGLVAVGVAAVLSVPFLPFLAARTTLSGPVPTETRSIDERIAQARLALGVIADHPVLGTGLGTLPLVLPDSAPDFEFSYQPAHVVALDAAAETGVVGLLAYLALVVGPWVALSRMRSHWTRSFAGTSAALAAVTVVGLFDFYTWAPTAGRTWAWIVLGLWVVAYRAARARGGGRTDVP